MAILPVEGTKGDPAQTISGFEKIEDTISIIRDISNDPLPSKVAEIHAEIRGILRLHQEIYDGIELATDQIQDKRIDFLEAGPEVVVNDLFVEFAFDFFVPRSLGVVLKPAFRFLGKAASNIKAKDLRDFFESIRKNQAIKDGILEFTKSGIKTTGKATAVVIKQLQSQADSATGTSSAQDTPGVQVKSRGQSYLHKIESFLWKLASDVDMLYSISISDRQLRPQCQKLLEDIHKSLQRPPSPAINAKELVQREFEKLIWALLISDKFFRPNPEFTQERFDANRLSGISGLPTFPASPTQFLDTRPSSNLVQYLKFRFFINSQELIQDTDTNKLTEEERAMIKLGEAGHIFLTLRKLKEDFLKTANTGIPISVVKISFKNDETKPDKKPNSDNTTPAK